MSAALAEPTRRRHDEPVPIASTARAEASRANGRLSRGPDHAGGQGTQPAERLQGRAHRRRGSSCRRTRRRRSIAARPSSPATSGPGTRSSASWSARWRWAPGGAKCCRMRIIQHDARMNAARFANWEQDEQLAAAELGRRLADDPEAAVARLQRTSAGCDWLIGRWALLGNGLSTADEGGPGCTWTDADLALALNLLGRPTELRHLDDRASPAGVAPRAGPVGLGRGRDRTAGDHRGARSPSWKSGGEEVWEAVEQPLLRGLARGAGHRPGTRGDAAAPLRGGGRPALPLGLDQAGAAAEGARRALDASLRPRARPRACPAATRGTAAGGSPGTGSGAPLPGCPGFVRSLGDPAATVLDFWVCGPPRPGISPGHPSQNKTNPAPGRPDGATPERGASPGRQARETVP